VEEAMVEDIYKHLTQHSVEVPKELSNRVTMTASRLGTSVSEIVQAALHQFLDRDSKPNSVFLSAPIDALMKGCYEENMPISELKQHGNFGLGTFNKLDGEMVMLDGTVYQLKEDGLAHVVDDAVETPFSCVTFFSPTTVEEIDRGLEYVEFKNLLDRLIPSENIFFALRIDGDFSYVRVWTVQKQESHRPISEVRPTVFEYHDVKGTLAGFFTPRFVKSLLNPGYHLHFLTDDRLHGGHLDQCRLNRLSVGLQIIPRLELNLPITIDYLTAKLV
jgi:acetolactate decarboxylase